MKLVYGQTDAFIGQVEFAFQILDECAVGRWYMMLYVQFWIIWFCSWRYNCFLPLCILRLRLPLISQKISHNALRQSWKRSIVCPKSLSRRECWKEPSVSWEIKFVNMDDRGKFVVLYRIENRSSDVRHILRWPLTLVVLTVGGRPYPPWRNIWSPRYLRRWVNWLTPWRRSCRHRKIDCSPVYSSSISATSWETWTTCYSARYETKSFAFAFRSKQQLLFSTSRFLNAVAGLKLGILSDYCAVFGRLSCCGTLSIVVLEVAFCLFCSLTSPQVQRRVRIYMIRFCTKWRIPSAHLINL